ncbi:hypothetical protein ACOMHN_037456 [Nucella lapillus]
MIEKYSQHFQKVHVVVNSFCMTRQAWRVLSELCQRSVVKSLSLRLDVMVSKSEERAKYFISILTGDPAGQVDTDMPRYREKVESRPASEPCTAVDLIERLASCTDITIQLPSSNPHSQITLAHQSCEVTRSVLDLCRSATKKTQLKKLIMRKFPCDRYLCVPLYTAERICSFPNLHELWLNVIILYDQLLLKLSEGTERGTSLRRLVIIECRRLARDLPVPELTSSSWGKLARACPSLAVECSVVADHLPPMFPIIKLETPLVKVEAICRECDEINTVTLYDLCAQHTNTLQHLDVRISTNRDWRTWRMQEALVSTVRACSQLRHLVCNIEMAYQLFIDLATCRRWRTFRVNIDRITNAPSHTSHSDLKAKIREAVGIVDRRRF